MQPKARHNFTALSLLFRGAVYADIHEGSEPLGKFAVRMRATSRLWWAFAVASGLTAPIVVVTITRRHQGNPGRNFHDEQPEQDLVPTLSARTSATIQAHEVRLRTQVSSV